MRGVGGGIGKGAGVGADLNAHGNPRAACRGHVARFVAEHHALCKIERELAGGAQKHPGLGLAAVAGLLVGADSLFRMMRAVVDPRDRNAFLGETRLHPGGEPQEIVFAVVPPGDARLIGDDDDRVAEPGEFAAGLEDAGKPLEVFGLAHVTVIGVDHAVTVKKGGFLHQASTFGWASRR